jgi:hypothetical protein
MTLEFTLPADKPVLGPHNSVRFWLVRWCLGMKLKHLIYTVLFTAALVLLDVALQAQQARSRTYWKTPLDSLAVGHHTHTHAAVTGKVTYVSAESDGDYHIRLTSPSGRFIVAECIPQLPCPHPKVGQTITVKGITRWDPEHSWNEIHPVEMITTP